MGHDIRHAGAVRHVDGRKCLGQRANLVHFHQHGVCAAFFDAHGKAGRVRDEQVISNQLDLVADHVCQGFPTVPIIFGHAVFDRDNRVIVDEGLKVGSVLFRAQHFAFAGQVIRAILEVLGGGAIEGKMDFLARLVSGGLNGLQNEIKCIAGGVQVGCKAALIPDAGVVARIRELFLEGVEHFRAHADSICDAFRGHGHDHEFLNINRVISVFAAIDNVHHRHGQSAGIGAADIAKERLPGIFCGGFGSSEGHAKDRVGPEPALVVRAVQFDHGAIDGHLFCGVKANQSLGDLAIYGRNGLEHALALVPRGIPIALFHGLVGTC